MKSTNNLQFLTSIKFFILIFFTILILFNFFDIYLFKLSRSFPGIFFIFFKSIIDPISDVLDPLNLIIFCLLVLLTNSNIKFILKNDSKLKLIKAKTNFSEKKIKDLFIFISLVCKHFLSSLAIAGISCNILKYIFGVSRPKYFFLEGYERINYFNIEHKISSFPSGHTQAAFTLAILLVIYLRRYYILIFTIATLMGLSRIFMSMHFPSDLIAGAYLGAIIPLIIYDYYFKTHIEKIVKNYKFSFKDLIQLMYWRVFI